MDNQIQLHNGGELKKNESSIVEDVLSKLNLKGVDDDKIAETISSLLDAKTLNSSGDEMDDNKVRLDTLKLVLKLHGVKLSEKQINIAVFNNPPAPDQPLNY